jgi:hypothetical protein
VYKRYGTARICHIREIAPEKPKLYWLKLPASIRDTDAIIDELIRKKNKNVIVWGNSITER